MGETYKAELATFGNGALAEALSEALERITENILDKNTSATEARSFSITGVIKPGKGRTAGGLKITLKTKLAGPEPIELTVFMGRENGHPVMMEHNPDQMPLPLAAVSIDSKKQAAGDE